MKRYKWTAIILVVAMVTFLFALPPAANSKDQPIIRFGTAPMGGSQYPLGLALEQIWNKKISDAKFSSQATGGSIQNLNLIGSKEIDIGFTMSTLGKMALAGTGPYKGNKIPNARVFAFFYPSILHVVVKNKPEFKSVYDLRGKKISCGAVGSFMGVITDQVLDAYGMSESDVKLERLSHSNAADALKDGHIDSFFYSTFVPKSLIADLLLRNHAKLLPLEESVIQKATAKNPDLYRAEIPANSYKNQKVALPTLAGSALLVCDKDLPVEIGYQMVKVLYENNVELVKQNKNFRYAILENALNGLGGIPLYSGTEKYLREKGVLK